MILLTIRLTQDNINFSRHLGYDLKGSQQPMVRVGLLCTVHMSGLFDSLRSLQFSVFRNTWKVKNHNSPIDKFQMHAKNVVLVLITSYEIKHTCMLYVIRVLLLWKV